jgi:hypothetical protein
MDALKDVPGPYCETSVSCFHIKAEEDIDVREQKDPLLVPFPFIKSEQEVRYSQCVHCHTHFINVSIVFGSLCGER